MDHQEAVATQATERYLLQELSPAEIEDFELHYFECPDCARSVEAGMQLVENARAVFSKEGAAEATAPEKSAPRTPFWSGWAEWWRQPAFAAALVLGGVALYQGAVVIPGARQLAMQAQSAAVLPLTAASRGEVEESVVPPGVSSLVLSAVLPPDVHFTQYRWVLASEGRTLSQDTISAPKNGQPLLVTAPVRGLRSAAYELTVYGLTGNHNQDSDRIDTYRFHLRVVP